MQEPEFKTIRKWTIPAVFVATVIWMLSDGLPAEKDPAGYLGLFCIAGFLAAVAGSLLAGIVLTYLDFSRGAQHWRGF